MHYYSQVFYISFRRVSLVIILREFVLVGLKVPEQGWSSPTALYKAVTLSPPRCYSGHITFHPPLHMFMCCPMLLQRTRRQPTLMTHLQCL